MIVAGGMRITGDLQIGGVKIDREEVRRVQERAAQRRRLAEAHRLEADRELLRAEDLAGFAEDEAAVDVRAGLAALWAMVDRWAARCACGGGVCVGAGLSRCLELCWAQEPGWQRACR